MAALTAAGVVVVGAVNEKGVRGSAVGGGGEQSIYALALFWERPQTQHSNTQQKVRRANRSKSFSVKGIGEEIWWSICEGGGSRSKSFCEAQTYIW